MQSLTFIILTVSEKITTLKFCHIWTIVWAAQHWSLQKLTFFYVSHKQFAVYDSNIPVTLKQGHGHQTWYELLDPKQGYYCAQFERPKTVSAKKPILSNQKTSIISLEYVQKWKTVLYSLSTLIYLTIPKSLNLIKYGHKILLKLHKIVVTFKYGLLCPLSVGAINSLCLPIHVNGYPQKSLKSLVPPFWKWHLPSGKMRIGSLSRSLTCSFSLQHKMQQQFRAAQGMVRHPCILPVVSIWS